MHEFTVNSNRFDPYRNFKFRIRWDGRHVAGISKVSALSRTTEVVLQHEDGDPITSHKYPGQTTFEPVTLEGGITCDKDFVAWASKVWNFGLDSDIRVAPPEFRRDIVLEFSNEAGQLVLAYKIFRCWVSEYSALPCLDATGNAVAIELITLENEGWERDTNIAALKEHPAPPPARRSQHLNPSQNR